MLKDIDPLDVYVDPNSSQFFDDAENIIISRNFTKSQAKSLYPQNKNVTDVLNWILKLTNNQVHRL